MATILYSDQIERYESGEKLRKKRQINKNENPDKIEKEVVLKRLKGCEEMMKQGNEDICPVS